MGTYVQWNDVKDRVEKINSNKYPRIMKNGYKLIAKVNNGIWDACPVIPNEEEYNEFYVPYINGYWLSFNLYWLPDSVFKSLVN